MCLEKGQKQMDYAKVPQSSNNKNLIDTILTVLTTELHQAFRVKDIDNSEWNWASSHSQSSSYFQHSCRILKDVQNAQGKYITENM